MNYEIDASELTAAQSKEKFDKHGFLCVRGLFSSDLVDKIISEAKSLSKEDWEIERGGQSTFLKRSDCSNLDFSGITYAQPITSYLKTSHELMGCELLNGANHLLQINDAFYKGAEMHIRQSGSNHLIPAHQDNFYFGLASPRALTSYVYLTEQNRNNGALGFLPTKLPSATLDHELGMIEGFSSFNSIIENKSDEFLYPSTQPGDVIFHHASTFHRADSNKTLKSVASISVRVFSRSFNKKDPLIQHKYSENLQKNRRKTPYEG